MEIIMKFDAIMAIHWILEKNPKIILSDEQSRELWDMMYTIGPKLYSEYKLFEDGCAYCGAYGRTTERYHHGIPVQVCKNGCE